MNNIIFKAIVGSQAYGTNLPTSDTDIKGVYQQPNADILCFRYKEQMDVTKDEVYYEVKRFLELLSTANPNILELLYSPADCILQTTPQFELIVKHRDKFLTKHCAKSFAGYAVGQIQKAKGLNKKMNWEQSRVTRKTPLDFIYVNDKGKSMPIDKWLKREGLHEAYCGLAKIDHFGNCYALYYDYISQYAQESNRPIEGYGFKGICGEESNSLRLSSIPKDLDPLTIIHYHIDGYTEHCKDYKSYQEWLENRNTQRYVDVQNHNQKIDGKNLMHCVRLIDTALEIAKEGTINVRRPNSDYLLKIRKGEFDLEYIINEAEIKIKQIDEAFQKSNLPNEVDKTFLNDLLLEIRNHG